MAAIMLCSFANCINAMDYVFGNISGAVMANKKLSEILNRGEKKLRGSNVNGGE